LNDGYERRGESGPELIDRDRLIAATDMAFH
jgi:hypothetical protein